MSDFERTPAHYRFLAETGYDTVDEWAYDSDYAKDSDGNWYQNDNPGDDVDIRLGRANLERRRVESQPVV